MTIHFITGNKGKFITAQNKLSDSNIALIQTPLELIEPQSMDIEFISQYKAKTAFEILKKPLIVHDAGFFIDSLNGFPGPYIKDVSEMLGNDGILKLMQGQTNRNCKFVSCLSYCDKDGNVKSFISEETGEVAENEVKNDHEISWGSIWNIYKPDWGGGEILSQLTPEFIQAHERSRKEDSEFYLFGKWMKN
jgi:XTP/dITP diphosphohydrolase